MEMFVYSLSLFGAKLLTDVSLFKTKYRCMAAIPRKATLTSSLSYRRTYFSYFFVFHILSFLSCLHLFVSSIFMSFQLIT